MFISFGADGQSEAGVLGQPVRDVLSCEDSEYLAHVDEGSRADWVCVLGGSGELRHVDEGNGVGLETSRDKREEAIRYL